MASPGVRFGLPAHLRRPAQVVGPALGVLVFQLVVFWIPPFEEPQVYLLGLTQGLLVALMATGLSLVQRANRVINFAQADLGILPAAMAANLIVLSGINYLLVLFGGILAALLVGGVVELAIMRRFFAAPRLVTTVATIGVAQLLAVAAIWIPTELWDREPVFEPLPAASYPFDWTLTVGGLPFRSQYLIAWVLAPVAMLAVAAVLRYTNVGIAMRASAESADRALLLGIPVKRIHTYVWAMAGGLSFISLFLSAGLFGLPVAGALGLTVLLGGLTALLLGRMSDLPAVVVSAVAVGILIQAVTWKNSTSVLGLFEIPLSDLAVPAALGAVIVATLLLRRSGGTRLEADTTSTWRNAEQVRPVPRELRGLPEVRAAQGIGVVLVIGLVVALPWLVGTTANVSKAAALVAFAVIGLSLVVLVGWAGQVSLGQLAFAAVGGAVAAKAITEWDLDPAIAIGIAAVSGAVTALIVGLPALRVRGLYLAVVTLAFALAAVGYFLNPSFFEWVPTERMSQRPAVFGVFEIDSARSFYYLCVMVGLVVAACLEGLRRSRTGRVFVATRDNEAGVAAYGVSVVRTKLAAFAISGAVAAVGGALLVLLQRGYTTNLYLPFDNLVVFSAVVVGGVGSLVGGVIGALFLKGGEWWLRGNWRLLVSGAGLLIVLLVMPGGLGGALFQLRDQFLRFVARRRGMVVPSLMADPAEVDAEIERSFEESGAVVEPDGGRVGNSRAPRAGDGDEAINGSEAADGTDVADAGDATRGDGPGKGTDAADESEVGAGT